MRSSGLLLYRRRPELEVWIGHMGGPFWERKDAASWSIPKGEVNEGEADLDAALREFAEEIGNPAPEADWTMLGEFVQPSRKIVVVFAAETDFVMDELRSNTFPLEWPRHSGIIREFPELDDARWVGIEEARHKVVAGQRAILDAVEALA